MYILYINVYFYNKYPRKDEPKFQNFPTTDLEENFGISLPAYTQYISLPSKYQYPQPPIGDCKVPSASVRYDVTKESQKCPERKINFCMKSINLNK